jgi:hypothetical protein
MAGPSRNHGLIAGARNRPFTAWSNAGRAVIYNGVEFSVTATSEPNIWQWRFQISDKITSGKTTSSLADHGHDRKI